MKRSNIHVKLESHEERRENKAEATNAEIVGWGSGWGWGQVQFDKTVEKLQATDSRTSLDPNLFIASLRIFNHLNSWSLYTSFLCLLCYLWWTISHILNNIFPYGHPMQFVYFLRGLFFLIANAFLF